MAISSNSNRSPSPISSRTNSNSRTQENSCIRKSFSGDPLTRPSIVPHPRGFNPVTPANSPADFPKRNSGHRESLASLRVSYEQKENEKDQNLKPARVRSPAISTGTKSFMAPTISASSKINASPRKKVLTERNEAVRTSTSFSAGKSPLTAINPSELAKESSNSETIFDSKVPSEDPRKSDATLVSPASYALKSTDNPEGDRSSSISAAFVNSEVPTESPNLLLFSPEPRTADSKCNNADLGSKVKPSLSPSPVLAPMEVDPSLPPYDPKSNYLSPRPQFLRYKPNPRIEGKRLLESFSSESTSETENTEESQPPSPQKECEDAGSSVMVSEEENENCFSEPELNTNQNQNEVFRVNGTQKSHFLLRSKPIPLLLVLVVACLCFPVTDTPIQYPSLFKTQTFSRLDSPAKFAELAKTKLDVLSHDVKLWSVNSLSYLSNLISFPNGVEQIGPLEFVNSTSPDEEHLADLCPTVDYGYNPTEEWQDVETVENEDEEIPEIQTNVEFEEEPQLIVQASNLKPENSETGEFLDKGDLDPHTNIDVAEEGSNIENEEQSPLLPQVRDVEYDISEADSQGENNIEPTYAEATAKISGSDDSHGSSHGLETPESSLRGSTYRFPELDVLGISSVVVAMLVAALLYLKQNKASTPKAAVPMEKLATKKFSLCSVSASSDLLNHDRTSLTIWPADVEKVGDSGPSVMSSTLQGSSNSVKKASDRANEVQSHERKPRRSAKRESLVSSSEFSAGSPSYGSFTTYEKIQSKHGSGDEGMVTPLRRSSRIRNQITSP